MKRMILKNWLVSALLVGACCGFVACDNDKTLPSDPDVTNVIGEYTGTMDFISLQPVGKSVGTTAASALEATVMDNRILIANFPLRDLIVKILGTDENIDTILGGIEPIYYVLPYTAVISEDKATIQMTFKPEPLKFTINTSPDSETLAGDEETGKIIEVELMISAPGTGTFKTESEALLYNLTVNSVKVAGEDFPMDGFSLHFNFNKQ